MIKVAVRDGTIVAHTPRPRIRERGRRHKLSSTSCYLREICKGVPKRVPPPVSDETDEPLLYPMILAFRILRSTTTVFPLTHKSSLLGRLDPVAYTHRRSMSVFNSSRLQGKTVLITGASAGIGAVSMELVFPCNSVLTHIQATAILFAKVRRRPLQVHIVTHNVC